MPGVLVQVSQLGTLFSSVAANDPISAILLALGAILTVGTLLVLAYLVVGGLVDLALPDRVGAIWRPGN